MIEKTVKYMYDHIMTHLQAAEAQHLHDVDEEGETEQVLHDPCVGSVAVDDPQGAHGQAQREDNDLFDSRLTPEATVAAGGSPEPATQQRFMT